MYPNYYFSGRNGLYAKKTSFFVIVMKHSNSDVHEALKIKIVIGYVISSVVNMISEKCKVLDISIIFKVLMKIHWVRNGLYVTDCMHMSK